MLKYTTRDLRGDAERLPRGLLCDLRFTAEWRTFESRAIFSLKIKKQQKTKQFDLFASRRNATVAAATHSFSRGDWVFFFATEIEPPDDLPRTL